MFQDSRVTVLSSQLTLKLVRIIITRASMSISMVLRLCKVTTSSVACILPDAARYLPELLPRDVGVEVDLGVSVQQPLFVKDWHGPQSSFGHTSVDTEPLKSDES